MSRRETNRFLVCDDDGNHYMIMEYTDFRSMRDDEGSSKSLYTHDGRPVNRTDKKGEYEILDDLTGTIRVKLDDPSAP